MDDNFPDDNIPDTIVPIVPDVPEVVSMDCTSAFTTARVFSSRDDLLAWARDVGMFVGCVVIILRSDYGQSSKKTFVMLGCEKSGKYKPYKTVGVKATGIRKCQCPFRLKGRLVKCAGGWVLKVMCGMHNHGLVENFEGHPYVGRLTSEELSNLSDMTLNMIKPRNALLSLQQKNPNSHTTIRQIYNARQKIRSSLRQGRTELQHLINLVHRDRYVHWHRTAGNSDVITDIVWAHPEAIKLVNSFNIVSLIDSTYKTNRYRMPLVEIVGVTSTEMTFAVAFAFVESEKADNYTWVLEKLKGMFVRQDSLPQVIVTDRELSLMNAVANVFPLSRNMLCQFHIRKNVRAKCKTYVYPQEKIELVMTAFDSVVDSPTMYDYQQRLQHFEDVSASFSNFIDYVKNTWLNQHRNNFVSAWIDRHMHIGNTTTNRVESAHWRLKKLLANSRGDLCNYWDAMNNMIRLQHTELKASFEHSISRQQHCFNTAVYKHLNGLASKNALQYIADELLRSSTVGVDSSACSCVLRYTHGLPCACELARYTMHYIPIPLEAVHIHWRKLSFENPCDTDNSHGSELSIQVELEALARRFQELDIAGKVVLKAKLRELAFPDTTSICLPPCKVNPRGAPKKGKWLAADISTRRDPSSWERVDDFFASQHDSVSTPTSSRRSVCPLPNKSAHTLSRHSAAPPTIKSEPPTAPPPIKSEPPTAPPPPIKSEPHTVAPPLMRSAPALPFIHQFPYQIHQYIDNIIDVEPDGNCGYRSIAALLGMGENAWPLIRQDLIREVERNRDDYVGVLCGEDNLEALRRSLYVDRVDQVAKKDKWMTMPDAGYVIANKYKVILICLDPRGSTTIFPLRHGPPKDWKTQRVLCIGFLHRMEHFVQVYIKHDAPIPQPNVQWKRFRSDCARDWETLYLSRMQHWKSIFISSAEHVAVDH